MRRTLTPLRRRLALAAAVLAGAAVLSAAAPAHAGDRPGAERTVTFTVANMTCALCPVTVRTAMEGVDGVRSVAVDLETGTARVVFDPSATSAESIATASANAGYPAAPSE